MFERDYSAGQARQISDDTFIPPTPFRRDRTQESTGGVFGPRTHYASTQDVKTMTRLMEARKPTKKEKPKRRSWGGTGPKPVEVYMNGEWMRFESIKQASEETGVYNINIIAVCKGQRNHAGGYVWRYA